ncbi:hypothetical protein MasN3_26720 [Massilia varians]|uniref:Uncharacterized protein n=1 Tax=Massilia varians TaxID=457921 RepID=A0ABN6TF23_9BURK|nr:hypothetical protein MasN3_26720 [Massilia varians]
MFALKPKDSRTLQEADSRADPGALWSVRNIGTAQGRADDVTPASVLDGVSVRTRGPAGGCLFCRYRSPGLGKDGMNA